MMSLPCFKIANVPFLLLLLLVGPAISVRAAANDTTTIPTATLSNGIVIPLVGLGCASGVRKQHVLSALEVGYRYLDTAQSYSWGYHESDVAAALQESPVARQEVFVTTKVHPENLGYAATLKVVQESLKLPGFEGYLDAVLIHKPRCWEGACSKTPEGTWQDSWKALEELYDQGLIKAIGICDINDSNMLDQLLQQRIQPHIIQNWLDPFHQELDMVQRIQAAGILFQGYSTLGTQWTFFRGLQDNPVQTSPLLLELAERHGAPGPAQVVLQWATQKGISVLPASKNPTRQAQNLYYSFDFQLTPEELKAIDNLDGTAPKPKEPDPNEISVTFQNPSHGPAVVQILWVGDDKKEVRIGEVSEGEELRLTTHHGHTFLLRDIIRGGAILRRTTMDKTKGKTQTVAVVPEKTFRSNRSVKDDEEEEL